MDRWRWWVMLLGPWPILAVSLGLSRWARSEPSPPPSLNVVRRLVIDDPLVQTASFEADIHEQLALACRGRADELREQLGPAAAVIVRAPFVLAGDQTADALDDWHRQTIAPAARALRNSYFDTAPHEPISVLLFDNSTSYEHHARQLFGDADVSIYGYYRPHLRTMILNAATGGGTVLHELTHALAAFDFPQMPDWFNEGLASLHEQSHIRSDESGVDGLVNWRLSGLQSAIVAGQAPSLVALLENKKFRGEQVGMNYAQARYLCLFLQQHGRLEAFYRRFRATHRDDPQGHAALLAQFPEQNFLQLDAQFQNWVAQLPRP